MHKIVFLILSFSFMFAANASKSLNQSAEADKKNDRSYLEDEDTLKARKRFEKKHENSESLSVINENDEEDGQAIRRDNPFQYIIKPSKGVMVSNKPVERKLNKEKLLLPSTARLIQQIVVKYKNLDGSVGVINKNVNASVDWHFPIMISQDLSFTRGGTTNKNNWVKFLGTSFLEFKIKKNTIIVDTEVPLIRDFMNTNPKRIILDFSNREDVKFTQKVIQANMSYFKSISIVNHGDFFRVAIVLDGDYRYKLSSVSEGYKIELY